MALSMKPTLWGWEPVQSLFNTHRSYGVLQCALKMTVDKIRNQVVKVWGRRDFPTNWGWSCTKGITIYQQLNPKNRLARLFLGLRICDRSKRITIRIRL